MPRSMRLRQISPTGIDPALLPLLISNRSLDFWLLALCSCILSLLCHSAAQVTFSPAVGSASSGAPSSAAPSPQAPHQVANFWTIPGSRPQLEDESEDVA